LIKAWYLGDIIENRKLRIPWSLTIPDALRATKKDVNIAQYWALTIPDALRATEKTVSFNTR